MSTEVDRHMLIDQALGESRKAALTAALESRPFTEYIGVALFGRVEVFWSCQQAVARQGRRTMSRHEMHSAVEEHEKDGDTSWKS